MKNTKTAVRPRDEISVAELAKARGYSISEVRAAAVALDVLLNGARVHPGEVDALLSEVDARRQDKRFSDMAGIWLNTPLPVHAPRSAMSALGRALERTYSVEWAGNELEALFWQKATAQRVEAGEECGASLCDEIERAAVGFGVSFTTLYRLVTGRAKTVSWRVAVTLRRVLVEQGQASEADELWRALLSPTSRRRLDEYQAYVARETTRLEHRRSRKHEVMLSEVPEEEARARRRFIVAAQAVGAPATRLRLADLRTYDVLVGWVRLRLTVDSETRCRLVAQGYRRERELVRVEMRALRTAIAKT